MGQCWHPACVVRQSMPSAVKPRRKGVHKGVVHVRGLRIAYQVAGAGRAVVLLHGLGGSARDWDRVLPDLAPGAA